MEMNDTDITMVKMVDVAWLIPLLSFFCTFNMLSEVQLRYTKQKKIRMGHQMGGICLNHTRLGQSIIRFLSYITD
jgi:hypothetical protein